jgi:putative membrane protein
MKLHAKNLPGLLAAGLLAVAPAAMAQRTANRLMGADNTFAAKAAQGNMAEVKLGQLAEGHAQNQDVKNFGQRMVTDHTKALDDLKSVAGTNGITLPNDISSKDQAEYDRLSKLNGTAFDHAYMQDMLTDHRADINEFKHEDEHGTNAALRAYASRTLPTLEEHLRLAESAQAKIKNEK